jgi:Protein of unknown function (DUF2917)
MSHFFQPTLSHWFWHATRTAIGAHAAPVLARLSNVNTPIPSRQTLTQHATYWVAHPQHRQVRCDAGVLWLAFDHDARDVVLEAGQTHLCQNDARLSIHALQQSVFHMD